MIPGDTQWRSIGDPVYDDVAPLGRSPTPSTP